MNNDVLSGQEKLDLIGFSLSSRFPSPSDKSHSVSGFSLFASRVTNLSTLIASGFEFVAMASFTPGPLQLRGPHEASSCGFMLLESIEGHHSKGFTPLPPKLTLAQRRHFLK